MIKFRQQIKELVTYILNPEERDEDVIENYTDTVMLACEEYHIKQLKLYGVVFNEVVESDNTANKESLKYWQEYDKQGIDNEVEFFCGENEMFGGKKCTEQCKKCFIIVNK